MTVNFDNSGRRIEIEYTHTGTGKIKGTAYFAADDLIADIEPAEDMQAYSVFTHPATGCRYRFMVCRDYKTDALRYYLDVERWVRVE